MNSDGKPIGYANEVMMMSQLNSGTACGASVGAYTAEPVPQYGYMCSAGYTVHRHSVQFSEDSQLDSLPRDTYTIGHTHTHTHTRARTHTPS